MRWRAYQGAVMQHPGLLDAVPYIRLCTAGSVKNCRAVFAIQSRTAGLRSAAGLPCHDYSS